MRQQVVLPPYPAPHSIFVAKFSKEEPITYCCWTKTATKSFSGERPQRGSLPLALFPRSPLGKVQEMGAIHVKQNNLWRCIGCVVVVGKRRIYRASSPVHKG